MEKEFRKPVNGRNVSMQTYHTSTLIEVHVGEENLQRL